MQIKKIEHLEKNKISIEFSNETDKRSEKITYFLTFSANEMEIVSNLDLTVCPIQATNSVQIAVERRR